MSSKTEEAPLSTGRVNQGDFSAPERTEYRFTRDGPPELEDQLRAICDRVREGVLGLFSGPVEGILLGGGYGRGEGGVLATNAGYRPYNDLEFYVFRPGIWGRVRASEQRALADLGHRLSREAGVEVEFKLMTSSQLRRSPPTMFFYDLVMGHRWLVGSDSLLRGCGHHRDASSIPLAEATRLLMNRCSGLLFSSEKLKELGPDQADFIGRNLAKAELALGDVLLTAYQRYHWSCLVRHERLELLLRRPELAPFAPLKELHQAGVEFKLLPTRTPPDASGLADRLRNLTALAREVWLWLEARRLRHPFASAHAYALAPVNKCPEQPCWKASLINLRTFGPTAWLSSAGWHYPRERLLHSLALLLFEPRQSDEPANLRRLQMTLRTRAATRSDLVRAYEQIWRRFN